MGVRFIHINKCVKCGHLYVYLPPSNYRLHSKYMLQLKEYRRIKDEFELYESDPHSNREPLNSEGNIVKKLPRKPQGSQPILRCHCVEMQGSQCELANTCPCGGRSDCDVCNCSCSSVLHVVDTANITA